tara:strand:+ start:7031 stop:7255 length:225 start_codon:yes stop_codon:yes gene_type:complete
MDVHTVPALISLPVESSDIVIGGVAWEGEPPVFWVPLFARKEDAVRFALAAGVPPRLIESGRANFPLTPPSEES